MSDDDPTNDEKEALLRRVWETDMEYRMSVIETAEAKEQMYRSIVAAYRNGWTEQEIFDALEGKVAIGYVRAAIENRPPRRPTRKGKP